jgi:hypothetical protein
MLAMVLLLMGCATKQVKVATNNKATNTVQIIHVQTNKPFDFNNFDVILDPDYTKMNLEDGIKAPVTVPSDNEQSAFKNNIVASSLVLSGLLILFGSGCVILLWKKRNQ